ncbi:hypothetical protein AMATHDRAFT_135279 [Amanita thiersii Skay4041]|uniref:Vacuolar import and degradation protein-domain-containing protein n=1 Tax=Amanita thiersii Skay4041 TaxID=703135 RepID=A0A2A9P0T2_9AGAR|nr:hypothetical protein AMATHDRAFT_135279 [Amanita thiersii Skay4041]
MPAHPLSNLHDPPQLDQPPPRTQVCAKCQVTLLDATGSVVIPEVNAVVCTTCRELLLSAPRDSATPIGPHFALLSHFSRLQSPDNITPPPSTRHTPDPDDDLCVGDNVNSRQIHSDRVSPDALFKPLPPAKKPILSCTTTTAATITTTSSSPALTPPSSHTPTTYHVTLTPTSPAKPRRQNNNTTLLPDPWIDITQIRMRTSNHHCLYPGATFSGTQKSGRSSYDVTVTVVDVDFSSSFLCGYLRIRGLTDDWPELTTYFDAEIIGSRYGFITQKWGASEQEDLVHWARFPAFKHLKPELKKPLLTMSDRDRGAVFMRWKERFLVPDYRVQDINGASFAGFYYVCVEFSPVPTRSSSSAKSCLDSYDEVGNTPSRPEPPRRARREASVRRGGRSSSITPLNIPVATMNGFYFHQNSEPYQQLSLTHVPERTNSGFEFR